MSKKDKEIAREAWEFLKFHKRKTQLEKKAKEEKQTQSVAEHIAKDNSKKSKLDRVISRFSDINKNESFFKILEKKAAKLIDKEYIEAISAIKSLPHIRDISSWEPRGKGKQTLFISLCEHLFAKYKTPEFIWSVFFYDHAGIKNVWAENILYSVAVKIGNGESFAKICKMGDFPVPLTNKQCHQFLTSTSDLNFIQNLRKVQILSHDGSRKLLQAWIKTKQGKQLQSKIDESFWDSFLAWLSKNPMFDLSQLEPLIDYIEFCRRDTNFSMKGRSVVALLRSMEEWHGDLAKKKANDLATYNPSGFKTGQWTISTTDRFGNKISQIWRIEEILSEKELQKEGSALRHCVFSYSFSIQCGSTSIWSMTADGEKEITIEVRNQQKTISQARGKCNRKYTNIEFKLIQKWATDNNLQINLSSW